jgi:hypothetical protein
VARAPTCSIARMPENDLDPGADTQQFQAFFDRTEPEEPRPRWVPAVLVGAALVGLVVVLGLAWLQL